MAEFPTPTALPLILFSGLGADWRVFAFQQREFPNLIVPEWRIPHPSDTLTSYCRRMASEFDFEGPVIVGGISFGGIVATEFARHVDARACLLISTIRSTRQLPRRIRLAGKFRGLVHLAPFAPLQQVARQIGESKRLPLSPLVKRVLRQLADADPRVIRWSIEQLFRFGEVSLDIPVRHIHGDRDPVFPIRWVEPDEVVHGGGHLLPWTHPRRVNAFLRQALETYACQEVLS